jgi:hypothetical protein
VGILQRRKVHGSAGPSSSAPAPRPRPQARAGRHANAVPVTIINPTSDAELERVLASAGPARGVVIAARHDMAVGDRPVRTRVHLTVRPRLIDGLGDEAELHAFVGWRAAALLEPGLEIPIQLNRTSGRIDAIATDLLARELAPRAGEAGQRWPEPCTFRPPTGPAHPGPDR